MLICKPVVTTRCSSIHFLCWFLSDLCDLWWWSNSNENQGSRFVHAAKIRTLVWWKPVTLNENLGPNVHTTSSAYTPLWDENLKPQGIYRLKFWTTAMGWKPISKEDPRYESGMNFRDELMVLEGPAYVINPSAPNGDQRSLCTEAPLHEVTSWNRQQFFRKNPSQELSGTHLLPKKRLFQQICSKNLRNILISEAGPHSVTFTPSLRWNGGPSGPAEPTRGVSPKIRLRRLPTSGLPYERPRATRALRWGAPQAADPPTPGPEKHQKSFRRVGESFLAGIRVAHKRLQEQNPAPPPFWGYLKSKKSVVLTHFSDDFQLFAF